VTAIAIRRPGLGALGRIGLGIRVPTLAIGSIGLYLVLGSYLSFVVHAYHGDAFSRVANAYYVLFSRDPHLGAIGFVWNPLPSIFELVLLPLKGVIPALSRLGFAANIMSATFMGLSVVVLNGLLAEAGVRRSIRVALVAAFALHPMILYYGAVGTSEAPMIFFSLLAARYLVRYVVSASTGSLVGVGIALAGAYLTRYEAAAGAVGAAALIAGVAFSRAYGGRKARLVAAGADVVVALVPFVVVFVAWALANWVIVGTPFSQFTSNYGNSAQMAVSGFTTALEINLPLGASVFLAVVRLAFLSLLVPVGAVLALWNLIRHRDARALAVGLVLGPMLLFDVAGYVFHVLAPWLRYFILEIPLGIVLIGLALAPRVSRKASAPAPVRTGALATARQAVPRLGRVAAAAIALALAFTSVPVAAAGMLSPLVAIEEAKDIGPILQEGAAPDRPGHQLRTYVGEQVVAQSIDAMNLPRGSVLVDVFLGFPIVLKSQRPDTFVITPDRDFERTLADPAIFGVQYLLVPPNEGPGALDAINVKYPSLPVRPAFAVPVQVFEPIGTSLQWTLYKVVGSPS